MSPAPPSSDGPVPSGSYSDLLELSAAGDSLAFARLFDGLSPRVFGLILRVIDNRALAEEILQDVFLEAWTKARAFDRTRGTALTWILTIAHRRAVDGVRARRVSREPGAKLGLPHLPALFDHVVETVALSEEARRLPFGLFLLSRFRSKGG